MNDNKRWEGLRNQFFVKVQIVFFLIVGLLLVYFALWGVVRCTGGTLTCYDCPNPFEGRQCGKIIGMDLLLYGIACICWSLVIMKIRISDPKNRNSYILYKAVIIISVLAMALVVGWVVVMIVSSLISPQILG